MDPPEPEAPLADNRGADNGQSAGQRPYPLPTAQLPVRATRKKSQVPEAAARSFPTPFKCSGDFCGFVLQPNVANSSASVGAGRKAAVPTAAAVQLLFTADELQALGADNATRLLGSAQIVKKSIDTIDSSVSDSDGSLRVLTYKSIALAKGNKEHLVAGIAALDPRQRYLDESIAEISSSNSTVQRKRKKSHLLDSTAAQQFREGSRARIFGELDGVANYYRQVRVCHECYAIYSLLDTAREMTAARAEGGADVAKRRQQQHHRRSMDEQWDAQVEKQVAEKEKLYLRQSHKHDSPKPAAPVDQGSLQSPITAVDKGNDATRSLTVSEIASSLPALPSPKADSATDEHARMNRHANGTVSMPLLPSADSTARVSSSTPPSVETASPFRANIRQSPRHLSKSTSPTHKRLEDHDKLVNVEKYLRGESKQIVDPDLRVGRLFRDSASSDPFGAKESVRAKTPNRLSGRGAKKQSARVLLVCSDTETSNALHDGLDQLAAVEWEIACSSDAVHALRTAQESFFEVILLECELAGSMSGLEFAKVLRQSQIQRNVTKKVAMRTSAIICVTSKVSREDLKLYKDSGMDGCIGKPVNVASLHRTVQAALATFASSGPAMPTGNNAVDAATEAIARAKLEHQERRRRRRKRLEMADSLAMPGLADLNAKEDYVAGVFQMDAATAIPYCVLGNPQLQNHPRAANTFFNLVVIHDLFDTWERLQILLQPIISKYNGAVQVLVWNYPGQAYTSWRPGTVLNNSYHVQCFHALLHHVGSQGERLLRDAPYFLLGIGNGGNIATAFCSHSPPLDANTRTLVVVNSFTHIDAQLAQFHHDCLKVFACTPDSRPDLPVYFHTRFLFSSAYLARVSTPLALNLYTAVMNPISLEGRKGLCNGALAHKDLRSELTNLRVPILNVCSADNALVNAGDQAHNLLSTCGLTVVSSIGQVLRHQLDRRGKRRHSCILWFPGGHEVLQECKQDVLLLIEQLVTGFHEVNDVPHGKMVNALTNSSGGVTSSNTTTVGKNGGATIVATAKSTPSPERNKRNHADQGKFEDAFIDRVLTSVNQSVNQNLASSVPTGGVASRLSLSRDGQARPESREHSKWIEHQQQVVENTRNKANAAILNSEVSVTRKSVVDNGGGGRVSPSKMASWDPTTPAFERLSSNIIYKIGQGSKIYPDKVTQEKLPEVKEYMGWRVRRNQKRLQRMEQMASVIQRAFRAFYARMLLVRIKRERCAMHLQRLWRAKLARKKYKGLKKEDWAIRLIQRHWRGKMGRDSYRDRIQKYLAAVDIQRITRGWLACRKVGRIRQRRIDAVTEIQRIIRQYLAKRRMFAIRRRKNAVITIQRIYRGHIGRRRFTHERDKFLFSKTQSQGITFGKQMLMEYKLFGTKLQSEVALLVNEKEAVEREAEVVVKEICEFDEGIRLLEVEMHSLSQVETESLGKNLDEKGKWQLREQKMRLDREFTQMLAQIAQRREKLSVMEEKLQKIDKERLNKEEELKGLERKLVILLEEQQQELTRIKQKQQTRSQLMLDIVPAGAGAPSAATPTGSAFGSPFGGPTTMSPAYGPGAASASGSSMGTHPAVVNSTSAFTPQQREEANSLMESTETMMKFGFMSMSMTYFSSMNMVRAMRKIGAHHMTLDSAAVVSNQRWPEYSMASPQTGTSMGSPFVGFQPDAPPGSFPGQQPMQVAGWSVADVGRWLDTLTLGQYKRAFADAAVDGALLLHLNDEDLKNTLGMEHRLHRKKILTSVELLRENERIKVQKLYGSNTPDSLSTGALTPSRSAPQSLVSGSSLPPSIASSGTPAKASMAPSVNPASDDRAPRESPSNVPSANPKVVISFPEFCQLVRHGKVKQLKEALENLPDRKFDPLTVAKQFAQGTGTIYDDALEKSVFHINKSDENGNSGILMAAQNNNLKIAQLLLTKGANPNHQNKSGNTAGHYAMAYSFFDLGAWLLDPDKGGGRDDLLNENGLAAYDGLS